MKIGFFGTPQIASHCLEYLSEHFEVCFAVTGDDKPQGRSLRTHPTPVKISALKLGIPVLQPALLKDESFIKQIESFGADIFVVVAYGRIIPRSVFDMPRFKTINLHPSLLPHYRGAAPVESAIRSGEKISGITVQYINERLDAGDIVLQKEIPLNGDMTSGELFEIVLPLGAEMLKDAIDSIENRSVSIVSQNESAATLCHKITRESALIDWSADCNVIHNLVRAYNPKPVAWSIFRGAHIKIWRTRILTEENLPQLSAGELCVYQKRRLLAGTGSRPIEIIEIQPETKKLMDGASFINGYRLAQGDHFTAPDSEAN